MEIVSDYLVGLAEAVRDNPDRVPPKTKRWVDQSGLLGLMSSPDGIDERKIMICAGVMMREAGKFFSSSEPDEVLAFRRIYEAALEAGDDYFREVFSVRRIEVLELIREHRLVDLARMEKELGNMRRGLDKRLKEYDVFYDQINGGANIEIGDAVFRGPIRKVRGKIENIIKIKARRVTGLILEIQDLERQIADMESRIEFGRIIQDILGKIDRELASLQVVRDEVSASVGTVISGHVDIDHGVYSGVSKKRRRKLPDEEGSVASPGDSGDRPTDFFEIGLNQLREVIQIAGGNGSCVRVLVPDEARVRDSYLRQWANLLRELGFTGEVKAVSYFGLANNAGSPVIVPRKMNTHKNLWGNVVAPYFVVEMPPNLLMGRLDERG